MRIGNIINNYKINSFKSSNRCYFDPNLKDLIKTEGEILNYTELFRSDLDWPALVNLLKLNFLDKDSVNTYCIGSSDCSEAYSLAIALERNVYDAYKFFPIKCFDKDPVITSVAKSGRINLTTDDISKLNQIAGYHQDYFIDKNSKIPVEGDETLLSQSSSICSYAVSKKLSQKIQINEGDILNILKNIKDNGNSLILCRNIFRYLPQECQCEAAYTIEEVLKPGSIFIKGSFDTWSDFAKILECISRKYDPKQSFEKIMPHVYRKI